MYLVTSFRCVRLAKHVYTFEVKIACALRISLNSMMGFLMSTIFAILKKPIIIITMNAITYIKAVFKMHDLSLLENRANWVVGSL